MGDSVTTRVMVHECTLASAALEEEQFLQASQGSAFVSRANELVVISVTPAGLPAIHAKVTQLVERGLHSIIVSLAGIKTLERDALKLLLKARAYVENWAGFLRVCDCSSELVGLMRALGIEKDVNPQGSRAEAIESWKHEVAVGARASLPEDLKVDWNSPGGTHLDLEIEMPKAVSGERNLPAVEVAEVVVSAEDLPGLRRQVEQVLARGKRYVTIRLSFKQRMRAEDVQRLIEARDLLLQQGGQLVLASLSHGVATWLKLLDYEREFVIAEDVDVAEVQHRLHAAGRQPQTGSVIPARKPAEAPEAGSEIRRAPAAGGRTPPAQPRPTPPQAAAAEAPGGAELEKALQESEKQKKIASEALRRSRELEAALEQARTQVRVEPKVVEKVVEKIVEKPVERVVERRVEVPAPDASEIRRLTNDLETARGLVQSRDDELAKVRERLDFVEARYREADYARNELNAIARSSDDARKRFQTDIEAAQGKTEAAETRVTKLKSEVESWSARANELESANRALEERSRSQAARIKELEQQLAAKPPAAPASSPGDADARVQKLERDKAELLLESKREIERLTREQETLREELESAGEMIERLGKELELT